MLRRYANHQKAFSGVLLSALFALTATPAHAYIGPGLGAGAIITVVGVTLAVFLVAFALIYYPIKRRMKARRAQKAEPSNTADASQDS